jgi:hypothetical protein
MRICGTGHNGQIISVQSTKITIGSSRQCTVRLRSPYVAPVHCLILRGPKQCVVRRWTGNTCLNNATFEDSPLRPGDHLTVGPIELEILGDETSAEPIAAPANQSADVEQIQRRCDELEANLRSLEQQRDQWQTTPAPDEQSVAGRHQLEEERREFNYRLSEFENQQRYFGQQCFEFEARQLQLSQQQIQLETEKAQFEQSRQQLDEQTSQLHQRQQQFEEQCREFEQQRQQHNQQLGQASQNSSQSDEHQNRLLEVETRHAELQADMERRKNELVTSLATLVSDQESFAAQQRVFETARQEFAQQQGTHEEQLHLLALERKSFEQQRSAAQQAQETLDDREHSFAEREQALEAQQQTVSRQQQSLDERQSSFGKQQQVFDQQLKSVKQQQESLDEQQKRLEQQQEIVNRQLQSLTEQQQTLDHQQSALDEGKAAAGQQQEAFKAERSDWNSKQNQLQSQLQQRDKQIAQLSLELEQSQTAITTQHNDLETNRAREDEAFTKRSIELQHRVTELETQCEQFSQERDEFERNRQELQQQLSDLQEQHSALQTTVASAGEISVTPDTTAADESQTPIERELRRRFAQNHTEQAELVPAEQAQTAAEATVESTSTQPSSTDEEALFARLRALSVLKQDEPDAPQSDSAAATSDEPEELPAPSAQASETKEPAESEEHVTADNQAASESDQSTQEEVEQPVEEPPVVAASTPTPAPGPANLHSEDNLIDDYMTKLLQRMRGMSADEPPPTRQQAAAARTPEAKPATIPASKENTANAPDDANEQPMIPAKFEPRSAAPENTHNLAAMREIANLSARTAIASHSHRSGSNQAWTTVYVGGICLVLGILLLCLTPEFISFTTLCGLGGLGVGTYFMVQSRSLLRNLKLSKHHKQLQLDEIAREQHMVKPHEGHHVAEPEVEHDADSAQP